MVFVFSAGMQGREPKLCFPPSHLRILARARASLLGKELGGPSGLGPSGLGLQAGEGASSLPSPTSLLPLQPFPFQTALGLTCF